MVHSEHSSSLNHLLSLRDNLVAFTMKAPCAVVKPCTERVSFSCPGVYGLALLVLHLFEKPALPYVICFALEEARLCLTFQRYFHITMQSVWGKPDVDWSRQEWHFSNVPCNTLLGGRKKKSYPQLSFGMPTKGKITVQSLWTVSFMWPDTVAHCQSTGDSSQPK